MKSNSNTYFGGKGSDGTFQTIINQIPKCDLFFETHAGLAKITQNMVHAGIIVLNDKSCKVCEKLESIFFDRQVLDGTAWTYPCLDWYSSILDNNGTVPNYGNGDTRSIIIIENLDAIELLEKYKEIIERFNTVIYSDPPYPLDSRKSQRKVYEYEMTDSEHEELLQYLINIRCKQLISTYPNPIYQNILSDYNLLEFFSMTRKGKALENLYYNFEPPDILNDPQYLGKDYRERERLKKIKDNFIRKFKEFPTQLQNSILSEL